MLEWEISIGANVDTAKTKLENRLPLLEKGGCNTYSFC